MPNGHTTVAVHAEEPLWYTAFLLSLSEWGNVTEACRKAGIGRAEVYRQKRDDPSFRERWNEALEQAVDKLRREAWKRATARTNPSDTLLIFLLKAHDPMYRQANTNMNVNTGPTYVFKLDGIDYVVNTVEELEALPTEVLERLAKGDIEGQAQDYELK